MTTAPNKAAVKQRAQNGGTVVPAGAKVPLDHQSAKEDVTGPKDTVIMWPPPSEDGRLSHEYVVAGENLDDAELLEFFTDENFIGALRKMLGPTGWAAYKDNARNESGRVTASGAAEFLNHILEEVKRGNS
jgi:hypothetical protein